MHGLSGSFLDIDFLFIPSCSRRGCGLGIERVFCLVEGVLAITGGCGQELVPAWWGDAASVVAVEKTGHGAQSLSDSCAMVRAVSGSDLISLPILSMAWLTVEWSRPPKSLPIFGRDRSVRVRQRYMAE